MMQQIEYACKDVVFHFNRKHLEDETITMWVLKSHGETFYVNHVDCNLPWSTKETPDNPHTKGSIKIKECRLTIDPDNNATISKLTIADKIRLRNARPGQARIMVPSGSAIHHALASKVYEHSKFKNITGACSSPFVVCDVSKQDLTLMMLKYQGIRILNPNEHYYQEYDRSSKHIYADYGDRSTPYEYS